MSEPRVRQYQVGVCDACMALEPSECHTPGCIFWLCNMPEVEEMLDRMLLRPMADGKPIMTLEECLSCALPEEVVKR